MASAVSPLTGSSATTGSTSGNSSASLAAPPSEEMFLNLLVAQIQNQDPLNPTDSTQFVSQLAQFSELEQVIGIRSDIESQMSTQEIAQANTAANQNDGTTQNSNSGQTPSAIGN